MTDLLVYATEPRADTVRRQLANACASLGITTRLELFGTGSLYQRLSKRPVPPPPDLVFWFGPFAARAAVTDGFLQAAQPIDASGIGVVGADMNAWSDLAGVTRLAMADPERSEVGLAILLATLQADPEAGWGWWRQRVQAGLSLAEDDASAVALAQSGAATHALTLDPTATPLSDLASIPHMAGVASNSRNVEAAKRLLDWLAARAPAPTGLPLDIDWCTQNYAATRQRWAQSGFSPTFAG